MCVAADGEDEGPAPNAAVASSSSTLLPPSRQHAGVYPFAGREVARAFAMLSTELADCTDDLSGLAQLELDNLREWEDKFNWKVRAECAVRRVRPSGRGQRGGGAAPVRFGAVRRGCARV